MVHGWHNLLYIPCFNDNGCFSDVLLSPKRKRRVLGHERIGEPCAFWFATEKPSPVGRSFNGHNGMVPYVQGIYDGFL